jgi:ABC-type multidrug transport system permease subunit
MQRVRWLLIKDFQVLRRSPLTLAVLVVYPIVVALLIGFAFSRGPDKPTIAFLNELPRDESFSIGDERFTPVFTRGELLSRVHPLEVSTRAEAERKVRDGDALAALIVPRDTVRKLESTVQQPTVEVLVNEEDPIKGRLVDDTISSMLAHESQRVSRALTRTNLRYLELLLAGGTVNVLGREFTVLGLRRIGEITRAARDALPQRSPQRRQLDEVVRFNRLAQENFGLTGRALAAISEPIKVRKRVLSGGRVPLSSFASAIAIGISLMFVGVLLASGSLALERQENTLDRLVRGPVSRTGLLAEKVLLAAASALLVTLAMVLVMSAFVSFEWDRFALWLAALAVAALAFGALGTALGSLARDVSAGSLVAFALLLPIAFAALVPSGVVSSWLYDATRVVSAAFPFKPTLSALRSALYGDGALAGPLLHLAAVGSGYGIAARLALGRSS